MSNALTTLTSNLAKQFNMGDGTDLANTLKATCFKGSTQVTDAQMTALLVVAQQYNLNPFTRELFAFPDKGGIVPVVGVDGWARIINSHQQFDGMDFDQDADSCTCTIYRKDRNHPTKVTEWMAECRRSAGPWLTHPYRMLRHKSMIQAARLAFGFVGIYEQDEAERIIEAIDVQTGEIAAPAKPRRASEVAQAILPTPSDADDLVIIPQVTAEPVAVAHCASQPTAEPVRTSAPAPQIGEPASAGEMMNIIKTAAAKRIDLGALLSELNLALDPATLAGMTKDTFKTIKARL